MSCNCNAKFIDVHTTEKELLSIDGKIDKYWSSIKAEDYIVYVNCKVYVCTSTIYIMNNDVKWLEAEIKDFNWFILIQYW